MTGTLAQQQIVAPRGLEVPLLKWAAWADLVGPDGKREPFAAAFELALMRLHNVLRRDSRRRWGRIRVTVHRSWLDPQVRLLAECLTVPVGAIPEDARCDSRLALPDRSLLCELDAGHAERHTADGPGAVRAHWSDSHAIPVQTGCGRAWASDGWTAACTRVHGHDGRHVGLDRDARAVTW